MRLATSWYQTLAWKFFLRQAVTILLLVTSLLLAAYYQGGRSARASAGASLTASSQILERILAQQGRVLDAGLEVFTQYSGNVALVEQALETGDARSLNDTLVENLPRLGARLAIVVRPDGTLLTSTAPGAPTEFQDVGILQLALDPEGAAQTGHKGPFHRGFFQASWGLNPGVYHGVARTLRSPGGALLGAMLVANPVDAEAAAEIRREAIAAPAKGSAPAHLALLSHFRTAGSTLPEADHLDRLLERDPAFLAVRGQILDSQRSPVLPLELDGRSYLGMISPVRGVNALDLEMACVLLLPTEPLLAPFRTLQRAIMAVGAAGLLLALWLGQRSARSVTAPLQALASAAGALAEGHTPEALALVASQDEVGVLTRTFRSMLAELQAKDDLLALLASAGKVKAPAAATAAPHLPEATIALKTAARADDELLPAQLKAGEVFAGRYRVEGLLGRGGMGVVLKVRDLQLDEDVALKVVRASLAEDPAFLDQLKQEIRLARKITHRFVMRTHDFGEADGIPFVTMEFLQGVTLQSLLDGRGRLPLPLVLRIARQVAEGLEAAHAVQVVHRDIKPMNVLFDVRGDAKIMDFGLAAPARAADPGDFAVGTPRYMSPEQIRGERVDARSDLYALGIMMFELCAGVPPYQAPRVPDLLNLHLEGPVPALEGVCPEAPPDLALLVARLMAKRREDRPQSATEVVEILKIISAGDNASLERTGR